LALRQPRQAAAAQVAPGALVVGGGLAGMAAALMLANAGQPVTLVEREAALVERLRERTSGALFDDVISACADPHAQRLMLKCYNMEGDAVGAAFGGTRELVDQADIDVHHYRQARTIGSSGCSTRCMETIIRWLAEGKLSLKGFTSPQHFTMDSDPAEFFQTDAGGLRPVLYPWE
jgi:glycine/D-amino acid oxidase-like deaminating enzyme